MAIHRGIQSALFYYLSCAPCADSRYRKRRKREAALSRAERLALETEEFNAYRHPGEPSSTNPHWQSEIELGPTLVRRGKKKAATGDSQRGLQPGRGSSNTSKAPSLADLGPRRGSDRADSRSQFRTRQRDDEELWGSASMLDGSMYAASIRRPPTAKTAVSSSSMYHSTRNPAINDMHPPTVTKVEKREDVLWMMQPLPVAEVMSGKERAVRSRSGSGTSRLTPSSTNLSRQVSTRMVEKKLKAGTLSSPSMSREGSSRSIWNGTSLDCDTEVAHVASLASPKSNGQKSPVERGVGHGNDSNGVTLRRPALAAVRHPPRVVTTIPDHSPLPSETALPSSGNHLAPEASGLPTPPSSSDGAAGLRDSLVRRSTMAVGGQAGASSTRHKHEDSEFSIRPDLFDSWYTPEFELPKWVADYTKREVRQRWSMDI